MNLSKFSFVNSKKKLKQFETLKKLNKIGGKAKNNIKNDSKICRI